LAALTGIREEELHETWKLLNQRMNRNLRKPWNSGKHQNSERWRNWGEQEDMEGRGTSSSQENVERCRIHEEGRTGGIEQGQLPSVRL
jgi:hypothetical protein